MFEAGGFGVGVTVSRARRSAPAPLPPLPPGVRRRRSRLSEVLEPAGFSDAGLAGELSSIGDVRAQLAAYEAAVVAELARRRPVESDLTEAQPGHGVAGWVPDRVPVGVSEFLADELAVIGGVSRTAATVLAERSLVLVRELPATWAALADSLIDPPRANAIVKALGGQSVDAGGVVAPGVVAEVEAQALGWARAGETPRRLQERAAAALIAVDEAAADRRRRKAERLADVVVRGLPDGMAELTATLPAPVAAACREAVDCYARMARADGDARPVGQLRTMVLADLILRPWDVSREPVTAHLTVLAPLPAFPTDPTAQPGPTGQPGRPGHQGATGYDDADADAATVDGAPITAAQLRQLLEQLDALCPGGLQAPAGGTLGISLTDSHTGALLAALTRPELERLVRRGCPEHPPPSTPGPLTERGGRRGRGPGVGPASSTATGTDCGCAVLDQPSRVDRYEPTPAQHRFVQARDRTCRHPGCRRPAARTDLDHVCAHRDGGATDCTNLCCLCRRHHRLKTHAPGWRYRMTPDGTLHVTAPSGVTRTTRPPGLRLPVLPQLFGTGAPPDADDPPPF